MKQIIPFKKELLFKTKVSEITAISLEHTLNLKEEEKISGEFLITGEYKMTEGSINREKFSFTCPFEINLDNKYNSNDLLIDIDNFYYEVINNESLQVNIDIYIEGTKIEVKEEQKEQLSYSTINNIESRNEEKPQEETQKKENIEDTTKKKENKINTDLVIEERTKELSNPSILFEKAKKEPIIEEQTYAKENINFFEKIESSDTYVTYYVYLVKEEDSIDKIIERFNITKEELENYNDILNIKKGTKLIIPTHNE